MLMSYTEKNCDSSIHSFKNKETNVVEIKHNYYYYDSLHRRMKNY